MSLNCFQIICNYKTKLEFDFSFNDIEYNSALSLLMVNKLSLNLRLTKKTQKCSIFL